MDRTRTARKTWTRTNVNNLLRHRSGTYYARFYSKGKQHWKSLQTSLLEVAKARLREKAQEFAGKRKSLESLAHGRMTFGEAAEAFLAELESSRMSLLGRGRTRKRIALSTVHYRKQTVAALRRTWSDLESRDVRRITKADCEQWARRVQHQWSATRFNNTLGTLRNVFEVAIRAGAIHENPAANVPRSEVRPKQLRLPERAQFRAFVREIEKGRGWCSRHCADLVRFLAFTGCRKNEAANVLWQDVDFARGRVYVRETKGGTPRHVPMIPAARELLERLRAEGGDNVNPQRGVLSVREAQKAMDRAAMKVGMARITHHDLRHLFATVCIESGMDIPTLSRFLGHKDGGALAMKTYGHLRDQHAVEQAQKVSF